MFAIPAFLIVGTLAASPDQSSELARASASLESYLTRIAVLRIRYTETHAPSGTTDLPADPFAEPKLYEELNSNRDMRRHHVLLYAGTSLRMVHIDRNLDSTDDAGAHKEELALHKGKITTLDHTRKHFNRRSPSVAVPFPFLPVDPLGVRTLGTVDTPISEFLNLPGVTSYEGTDEVDGETVIIVKVGPNIPSPPRPSTWPDSAYLRLFLAPAHRYLPVRTVLGGALRRMPDGEFEMSLAEFKPVRDAARGDHTVPFPHSMRISYPNGRWTSWSIQSALINPPVSSSEFVLTALPGYSVAEEGRMAGLRGGPERREERVQESVEEARRLLTTVEPPRSLPARGMYLWGVAIGAGAALALLLVFFYCWR